MYTMNINRQHKTRRPARGQLTKTAHAHTTTEKQKKLPMGQHGEDPHSLSRVIALLVQSMGLGLVAFWWPIVVHPNLSEPEAATGYQKYTLFLQPV